MQTLILKSDNTKALEAIKTLAKVLDIESSMKKNDDSFEIIKGVKITKAKRKFNVKELAGSLTDLNLEDASILRKKAWTRKKAMFRLIQIYLLIFLIKTKSFIRLLKMPFTVFRIEMRSLVFPL